MSLLIDLAEQLEESELAIALHESMIAYPLLEGAHLLGLALSVGLLAVIDLRLIGIAFRFIPRDVLLKALRPWMLWGFVATFLTGGILFATSAVSNIGSPAFLSKLVFIVLAGINALWFEFWIVRQDGNGIDPARRQSRERLAGVFSLTLWALVIVTGRLIAYYPGSPV